MNARSIVCHVLSLGILATASVRAQAPQYAPCSLLTTDEVRRVFSDTKAGEADRRNEKAGIFSCVWQHHGGLLQIITGDEEQTPAEEARSWVVAFADPLNQSASSRVRFEKIAGVGDSAVAVVETADKAKGFMQGGAYIVVRKGKQQFTILAPGLATRERPAALTTLTELGRAAAGRLR